LLQVRAECVDSCRQGGLVVENTPGAPEKRILYRGGRGIKNKNLCLSEDLQDAARGREGPSAG
jgi:hypothetical protein